MQEDPEITFAVTSEVAAQVGSGIVFDTGIENTNLENAITDTLFELGGWISGWQVTVTKASARAVRDI